jgi:hypothetical protein
MIIRRIRELTIALFIALAIIGATAGVATVAAVASTQSQHSHTMAPCAGPTPTPQLG